MTCPAWRLVAEPRKGWNFFNLVKVSWKGVDVQPCLTQDPTVKNWGIGWANKVSFFSMDSLSFSHQCSCLWLFVLNSHEIMRVLCISKDFPLPMIPEDQTDLWRSQLPLPRTPAPTMLISPERFHPKHAVILATKKSRGFLPWDSPRLPCDEIWTKAAMEKWLLFKQIGNGNFCVAVWKTKTRSFQTWKQENHVARRVSAGCLFLAPKRICLKACWWVQR